MLHRITVWACLLSLLFILYIRISHILCIYGNSSRIFGYRLTGVQLSNRASGCVMILMWICLSKQSGCMPTMVTLKIISASYAWFQRLYIDRTHSLQLYLPSQRIYTQTLQSETISGNMQKIGVIWLNLRAIFILALHVNKLGDFCFALC